MGLRVVTYHDFRSFLRAEGCAAAFDRAFYDHNDATLLDEALWEAGDAEYIFGHAFDWTATPEGRDYWRAVDHRWSKVVRGKGKCKMQNSEFKIQNY